MSLHQVCSQKRSVLLYLLLLLEVLGLEPSCCCFGHNKVSSDPDRTVFSGVPPNLALPSGV